MQNVNTKLSQLYQQLSVWLKTAPRCHQLELKSNLACENTAGVINAKLASAVARQQDADMLVSPLNNFYSWAESSIDLSNRGDHANLLAESFFSSDSSLDNAALGVCQVEANQDDPDQDDLEQTGAGNNKARKQQQTTNQDLLNKLCFQLYGFDPNLILSQPPLASTVDLIAALSTKKLILINCPPASLTDATPSMASQLFAKSKHTQSDLFAQAPILLQVCAQLLEYLISKRKRVLVITPTSKRAQSLVSLLDPELQKLCFRGGQEFLYESLSKAHNLFKYVFCTPRKAFNIRGLASIESTIACQSARLQGYLAKLAWITHRESQLYSFRGRNISLSELIKWTCDNQHCYQQLLPPISKPQLKFPLTKNDLQQLYELNQIPTSTSEKIQEHLLKQPLDYFAVPTQDIIRLLQNLQTTGQHLQELTHQLDLMQQELKLYWHWSVLPEGLSLIRPDQPQSLELIPWSSFSSTQLTALSQLALSKSFDPVWWNAEPQLWSVILLSFNHWQQQALDHSQLQTNAMSAPAASTVSQVTGDSAIAALSSSDTIISDSRVLDSSVSDTSADTDISFNTDSDLTSYAPSNSDTESAAWYTPQNTAHTYQRLQQLIEAVNLLCQSSQECLHSENGFTEAQHQQDNYLFKQSFKQPLLELALSIELKLNINPLPSLELNVFITPNPQPEPIEVTRYSFQQFLGLGLTFHSQAQDILQTEPALYQPRALTIVSAGDSNKTDFDCSIPTDATSNADLQSGFEMLFEQQVAKPQAECIADTELNAETSTHVELIGLADSQADKAGGAGAVIWQATELIGLTERTEYSGLCDQETVAISTTAIVQDAAQALAAITEPVPTQEVPLADSPLNAQPALLSATTNITSSTSVSTTSVDTGLKNEPCSDQRGILSKLLTPFKAVGTTLWGMLCRDGESKELHDIELKTSAEIAQYSHWLDVVKQRQACAQQWDSLLVDMGYAHFYELSTDGMPEFQAQAILKKIQLELSYAERDLRSVVQALQCMGLRFEFLGSTPDSSESPDCSEKPESPELGWGAAGFLVKVSELKVLLTMIHQFLPLACQAIQAQIKFNGLSAQFMHYLMRAQSKAQSIKQAQDSYAKTLCLAHQEVLKLIQRKFQLGDAWLAAYVQLNSQEFQNISTQIQSFENSIDLSIKEAKAQPELRSELLQKLRQIDPLWAQAIQQHQGPHGSWQVPPNLKSAWHWRNLELALRQYTPLLDHLLFCKIHNCLTELWLQSPHYMRFKVQEISSKLTNYLSASDKDLISTLFAQHIDPPDVDAFKQKSRSKRNRLPDETIAKISCRILKILPCWILSWDEFLNQADKTGGFDVILYLDAHKLPVIAGLALRFAKHAVIMGKVPAAQQTLHAQKPQPRPAQNGADLEKTKFLLWPEDIPEVTERLKQLDFLVEPSPLNTSAHSDFSNPEASPAAQEPSPDNPCFNLNMNSLFEMILDKAILDQPANNNLDGPQDASEPYQQPLANHDIATDAACNLADGDNYPVDQHSKLGFVKAVANILRQRGWQVVQPYVASTYSLNLVVQYQGLKVAIECIGAYLGESQQQAAQFLKRQGFLEQAGWQVIYVFSTLFYSSPLTTIEQVEQVLAALGLHNGQEIAPEPDSESDAAVKPEAESEAIAEDHVESEPESAAAPTPPLKLQPVQKLDNFSSLITDPVQPTLLEDQRDFVAAVAKNLVQRGWTVMQHDTANLSVLDVVVPSKNIRVLIIGLNSDQAATKLPAELLNLHNVLKRQGWPVFNLSISQFYTTPHATCEKIEQKLKTLGLYPEPDVETECESEYDSSSSHANEYDEYDESAVPDDQATLQVSGTQASLARQARQPAAAEDILTPEFADPDLYQDPPLLTDIENSEPAQSSELSQRSVSATQPQAGHAPVQGSPDQSLQATGRLNSAAAAPSKGPEPSVAVAASKAKSPKTKVQASDFFWHEPQFDPKPKLSKVDKLKLEQDRIHLNRMASEEFNRGLIPHGFVQDSKSQLAHVSSMSQPEHKAFCKYKDELRHIVSQTAKDGVVCVNLIDAQIKLLIYLPKHSADKILLDYEARGLVFAQVKRRADPGFAWYHNLVPCVFTEFEEAKRTRMQVRHF